MKAKGIKLQSVDSDNGAAVAAGQQEPKATLPHIRHSSLFTLHSPVSPRHSPFAMLAGSLCTVRKARKSKVFALQTTTNKTLSNLPQLQRKQAAHFLLPLPLSPFPFPLSPSPSPCSAPSLPRGLLSQSAVSSRVSLVSFGRNLNSFRGFTNALHTLRGASLYPPSSSSSFVGSICSFSFFAFHFIFFSSVSALYFVHFFEFVLDLF